MKIIIYCLKDPISNEIRYIGRTKNSLSRRLSNHISESKSNHGTYKIHWINSLKKRNLKPIIETIVELNCSWEESHIIEKKYIENYLKQNCKLTNLEDKGSGGINTIKCYYNTSKKKILQYSLEGYFISEFDSVTDAANSVGGRLKGISKSLTGLCKTAYGYQWRYKIENYPLQIDSTNPNECTKGLVKVNQLTLDGDFIKTWDSIVSAEKAIGHRNISTCCRGKQKTSGGFKWEYTKID